MEECTPNERINKIAISKSPDKYFKVMIIKILSELGKTVNKLRSSTKRKYKKRIIIEQYNN